MFEDSGSFGFGSSSKKFNRCKSFEATAPPEFKGSSVSFMDLKTGAKIELDKSRVSGFKRIEREGKESFKIKVCGK